MSQSTKHNLVFRVALIAALLSGLIVLVCGYGLLTIVKIKRIKELTAHSIQVSNQIISLPGLQALFLQSTSKSNSSESETMLKILLEHDPYISELVFIDPFGKSPLRYYPNEGDGLLETESTFPSLPLQDLLTEKKPSFLEKEWEYYIPVFIDSEIPSGIVKIKWRADATWKYFHVLRSGIIYLTIAAFFAAYALIFFLLRSTFSREQFRLSRKLSLLIGGHYSQRVDTQSYSKGMSEIGVQINRLLHEIEEEKKKSSILDQSLRQIERGCADYRRESQEKTSELKQVRHEMRTSLVQLFDLLWCGFIIVDDSYSIHYINDPAERLLRFARFDESVLSDERLKTCLNPLVKQGEVDSIDDLCVWPQPSLGQSVSCYVRATRLTAGRDEKLFIVLLHEEAGYPKKHNSAYFSERLVLDYLARDHASNTSSQPSSQWEGITSNDGDRFRACLRRLETFHLFEQGDLGPVSSIRLSSWLRQRFSDNDLFSPYLHLDANIPELDLSIRAPENVLRALIDTTVFMITRTVEITHKNASQYLVMRLAVDSRGKPMITLSMSQMKKRQATVINNILSERMSPLSCDSVYADNSLEGLEIDICYSLFRCVKQLLRVHFDCVYSENKKLAMVRLTIENHAFNNATPTPPPVPEESTTTPELVRQFLNR